ncbi:HNH endonuclease [Streptomyces cinerochromogenes]|uniref:HNH endonuclease n=1 Tax=Streptomyces cinerochromogenes TaxID=66422 RepID=A0ABW7BIX4_9ACTN
MTVPFLQRLNRHLADTAQIAWCERRCEGCGATLDPSFLDDYCRESCRPTEKPVVPAFVTRTPAARIHSFRLTSAARALPGTYFEDVDPLAVIEAAGWRCELCGGEIPKHVDRYDPQAASVDHHLPLALGGHHVRSNMRAAHRRCNISKNATHPDDLICREQPSPPAETDGFRLPAEGGGDTVGSGRGPTDRSDLAQRSPGTTEATDPNR